MKRNPVFVVIVLLLVACAREEKVDEVMVEEPTIGLQVVTRAMPKGGQVVDEKRGKEVWLAVGPVSGVGDAAANGVVQAHTFESGTYLLTAQVNIAMAPDGYFYEGWLAPRSSVEQSAGGEAVSLGHLRSRFGDVRHGLEFESDQDLRDRLRFQLTLEADDGDPGMSEKVVAEGVLKERTR